MIKNLNGLDINKEYTLPAVDGTNGQVMKTDGSGVLTWANDKTGAEYINDLLDAKTDSTSVFLGNNSGNTDDGTNYNVGVGIDTLKVNTSGTNNVAIGYNAMKSGTENYGCIAIGTDALKLSDDANGNIAVGYKALSLCVSSSGNTAIGDEALSLNTYEYNTAVGNHSLKYNTTGNSNSALGKNSLLSNDTGNGNTAVGSSSMQENISGNYNSSLGESALSSNISGSNNVAIGDEAGSYTDDTYIYNETSSNSVYIGSGTKSSVDGNTNEIVIGYDTTGKGSNTAIIGNDSIVETHLKGVVVMGKSASAPTGVEGGIYYDTVTKHFYGYDGTTWKQLDN